MKQQQQQQQQQQQCQRIMSADNVSGTADNVSG